MEGGGGEVECVPLEGTALFFGLPLVRAKQPSSSSNSSRFGVQRGRLGRLIAWLVGCVLRRFGLVGIKNGRPALSPV